MLGVLDSNLSWQHPTCRNVLRPKCCDMLRCMLRSFGRAICTIFSKCQNGMPRHCCRYYKRWLHQLLPLRNVADLLQCCRNVYSPSDFCINRRYSEKGEEKVRSLQFFYTRKYSNNVQSCYKWFVFFLVLTRRVVNLSNQGSGIFILHANGCNLWQRSILLTRRVKKRVSTNS